MKESKYIRFELVEQKPKTQVWAILTNEYPGWELGFIRWYGRWRQYSFFPRDNTVFNAGCLTDITNFINELMKKHKEKK